MTICTIYKYTSKIDGKSYIGKTTQEEKRIKSHKAATSNSKFHKAIKQFGFDVFDYEVLEQRRFENPTDADKWMKEKEAHYIMLHQTYLKEKGYNILIGTHPTKEILDYRSDVYSFPFYQINPADGKILYRWDKRKNLPTYFSPYSVAIALVDHRNVSHIYKGFIWIYEKDYTPEMVKAIVDELNKPELLQYDLKGNFIRGWRSIKEAASELGVGKSALNNVLSGLSRMCKKSVWVRPWDDASVLQKRLEKANIPLAHCKPIEQLDQDDNIIRRWSSSTEAVNYFGGKSKSSINNVLSGRRHTAFGYKWRYATN